MADRPGPGQVDWTWVKEWAGRVFLAAFPLATFALIATAPVLRPGGVMMALPQALLWGVVIAALVTGVASAVLAVVSARRG